MVRSVKWALGIEHEMLFGVRRPAHVIPSSGRETFVMSSDDIVFKTYTARLRNVYQRVAAALKQPLRYVEPRRPVGAEKTPITLSTVAKSNAHFKVSGDAAKIAAILGKLPRDVMHAFLVAEYPLVFRAYALFNMTLSHDMHKASLEWGEMVKSHLHIDHEQDDIDYNAWRTAGARLLTESDEVRVLNSALERLLDRYLPHLSYGDVVETSIAYGVATVKHIARNGTRRLSLRDTRVFVENWTRTFDVNLSKSLDGRTVELDGEFVEIKTARYRSPTAESVVAELARIEKGVCEAARSIDGTAAPLTNSGYDSIRIVKGLDVTEPQPKYSGSLHFWFTLPFAASNAMMDEDGFEKRHRSFADALQWMEPLLLTVLGGDPRAIGNGAAYPRASMRCVENHLSGIGTTDVCDVFTRLDKHKGPFVYYANAAAHARHVRKQPAIPGNVRVYDGPPTSIVYNGAVMKRCKAANRMQYAEEHAFGELPMEVPSLGKQSAHNELMKREHGAGFVTSTGNDIRNPWCGSFARKLSGNDDTATTASIVKKKNRFELVHATATTAKENPDKVGFEFRMMDNMPQESILPLLVTMLLVACASESNTVARCEAHGPTNRDADWNAAVAAVLVKGRYAELPDGYVKKLSKRLGLALPNGRRGAVHTNEAWHVRETVCGALHAKYQDHPWTKLFFRKKYASAPSIPDGNKRAWEESFLAVQATESGISVEDSERLSAITGTRSEWCARAVDILGSLWKHDVPYLYDFLH